ncbi:MAG: AI-2E family transporter [Kofleriaceae bacterium]
MTTSPQLPHLPQVLALLRWLLIAIFVVLGWTVLSYLAGVLSPILAALGITYLLNPVLERLVARGMRRSVGAGLLLASFIGLVVAIVMAAVPKVAHQLSDFIQDFPRLVTNVNGWLKTQFGFELPEDWVAYSRSAELREMLSSSSGPLGRVATAALGGVFSLLGVLAELLLIPVFSFYFLVDWPNLLKRIEHMIPPRRRADVRDLVNEIDRVVAGWVRGQAIVTSILAVLYALCFTIVGMPLSVPVGLLVGALTVIPFVGTFVGAGIAAIVTLADGGNMQTLASVVVVIVVLHLLEAGVLTPKIVGHRVGLSESGALLAVVAGGKLLGFVGVVLAVPFAATFAVLARYAVRFYEHTQFFGHESDADVVVTPAMAVVLPAVPIDPDVIANAPGVASAGAALDAPPSAAEWPIEPALGPSGATRTDPDKDKP